MFSTLNDTRNFSADPEPPPPLSPLQEGAVYGPIHSRRLGYSLGINPLPVSYKFCDFDCVYCQYGWTPRRGTGEKVKPLSGLLKEIEKALRRHKEMGTPVDCMTIAGNGEPTIYPAFLDFVKGLVELRDRHYPGIPIGILSDSSQCHRPRIREALEMLDERYMKLDAGRPEKISKINRPRGDFDFNRMVEALRLLSNIVIQSLFMQGTYDNTTPEDLDSWIKTIQRIRPREVQVYTLDRGTPEPGLRKASRQCLAEIAEACQTKTGIRALVYD